MGQKMTSALMIRWLFLRIGFGIWLLLPIGLIAQQTTTVAPSHEKGDGERLFTSNCAGCHGSDGRGGEHAPNIATNPTIRQKTDADLVQIITNGLPSNGMPAFGWIGQEKITSIVLHLRTLQGKVSIAKLPGNPRIGETIFTGKAQCSSCHKIAGNGGFIGSDLSFYGSDSSIDAMRAVILDPERNLSLAQKSTIVMTKDGHRFEGMLRAEDNFSLSLQSSDGKFHFFQRADLLNIHKGSRSLMPDNYRRVLSAAELDDLVSYLIDASSHQTDRTMRGSTKSDDHEE